MTDSQPFRSGVLWSRLCLVIVLLNSIGCGIYRHRQSQQGIVKSQPPTAEERAANPYLTAKLSNTGPKNCLKIERLELNKKSGLFNPSFTFHYPIYKEMLVAGGKILTLKELFPLEVHFSIGPLEPYTPEDDKPVDIVSLDGLEVFPGDKSYSIKFSVGGIFSSKANGIVGPGRFYVFPVTEAIETTDSERLYVGSGGWFAEADRHVAESDLPVEEKLQTAKFARKYYLSFVKLDLPVLIPDEVVEPVE